MISIKKIEFEDKDGSVILKCHTFEDMRKVFWTLYTVVELYRFEKLPLPFEMEASKETYEILVRDKSVDDKLAGIQLALRNLEGVVGFSEKQRHKLDSYFSAVSVRPPTESSPLLVAGHV